MVGQAGLEPAMFHSDDFTDRWDHQLPALTRLFHSPKNFNELILWVRPDSNRQCLPLRNGFTDRWSTTVAPAHPYSAVLADTANAGDPDGTRTHNTRFKRPVRSLLLTICATRPFLFL